MSQSLLSPLGSRFGSRRDLPWKLPGQGRACRGGETCSLRGTQKVTETAKNRSDLQKRASELEGTKASR